MKCEHKGCRREAEINICHNHINTDYPCLKCEAMIDRQEEITFLKDVLDSADGWEMFSKVEKRLKEFERLEKEGKK